MGKPVTTGEMLKGRSRTLSRKAFPGNWFRVMSSAKIVPQMVLTGTAMRARETVSSTCTRPAPAAFCRA